jgi:hypothetical protein
MSTLTETLLVDMEAEFSPAPKPIQRIPTFQSLINLLFHLCSCTQMHQSPASTIMNLLFYAAPKDIYAFLTTEAYPMAFAPFPPLIPDVPDFSECTDENERATVRTKHALNKKMRANIITMNIALTDIFLDCIFIPGLHILPTKAPPQAQHSLC